ncbi:hypothetical protein [Hungatella hathewayi]|uniref:hypothetical protein n=1 Tax=Hungatella hathewayi TaxID=154046 RepID=UPI0035645C41
MKIKKEMIKQLSILVLIFILCSFPSYAEEPTIQQETSIYKDEDVEKMNVGELLEEIKSLDKEDVKKIKEEVDKVELKKEKKKIEKIPLKTRFVNMIIACYAWLKEQLYNLRYPIIVLVILFVILKYIQHKSKGGGDQWEGQDKEKQGNYT